MAYLRSILFIILASFLLIACKQKAVLTDINGNTIDIDQQNTKWIVVNYWASWCEPCLKEIPELNDFYKAHQNINILMVGVNYDQETPATLRAMTTKLKMGYPTTTTDPATLWNLAPVTGLPTTYLISPQGKIQAVLQGGQTHRLLDKKMGLQHGNRSILLNKNIQT